jgi:hypothetical protein
MGIRTPDLLIANETLYQLSYTPNIQNNNPLPPPYQDPLARPKLTKVGARSLEIRANAGSGSDAASYAKPWPQSDEYVLGSP